MARAMTQLHTLDNGLRVAVDPGGSVPVVAVQLWFDVGSAREPGPLAGAAHLLEHMLFKSSEDLPAGEAVSRLEAAGGSLNAWTSLEQTALFVTLPAHQLERAISTLAEMATRPRLDPAELKPERGVVLEELREALDDPADVLAQELRLRAFGDHPYGRPILGTEQTVGALTAARLRGFHGPHYQPANAALVVCGPVDPAEVLALAAAHLGAPGAPPQRTLAPTPDAPARPGAFCLDPGFDERTVELVAPIPPLDHPDLAALDVLAVGMGEGGSALLPRVLRHERDLCLSCWAMLENERAGGLFAAGLSAREGQLADGARALLELVAQVSREGLPAGMIRRAKAAIHADRLRDRETVDGRASRLGWYVANRGDPAADLSYEAAVQRVSVSDVRRVAARYLAPARWVVGGLAPEDELDTARLQLALDAAAGPPPASPRRPARPEVVRLRCGARVLIAPDPDAEMLGVSVIGLGGAMSAGARNAGLPWAWSSVATRGAGSMDAVAFAAAVEERAGSLRAWSARSSSGVQLAFPGREVASAIDLLGEVLCRPRLDPVEIARTRTDLVELQRTTLDDAGGLARQLTWQALFSGHPWGWPTVGTAASVARLTPGRLRAYHRRVMCGSNLVIGVAGAVDTDEVVALLDRALASLPVGAPLAPSAAVVPARMRRARRATIPREGSPTEVVLAFPAPGQEAPEAPALRLLEAVLSGPSGGSGRLLDRIRERDGVAYSVGATAVPGLGGGALLCAVTADPSRADAARAALWEELDDVAQQPVPDDELARVKSGLLEGALVGVQRALTRADHLAAGERYLDDGVGWRARLEAPARVSAEALQALAADVLRHDRSVTVTVGPPGA